MSRPGKHRAPTPRSRSATSKDQKSSLTEKRWTLQQARQMPLIFGRLLGLIDDKNLCRPACGLQLQSELQHDFRPNRHGVGRDVERTYVSCLWWNIDQSFEICFV